MKTLLICDDYWHPGQIPIEGVAPLNKQGFEFDIISDAKEFKPETLNDYPAVILVKSDQASKEDKSVWKTDAVQRAFIAYVENGGGLLAVHSGTVPGKDTKALDMLLGCRFTFHPQACPVLVQPLKPHPVTEGVEAFCETDEHYRLEILSPDADIIMASYSPPQGDAAKSKEDPAKNASAWISAAVIVRAQGKGRVCVLTPGHCLPVWLNPQFQRTLVNSLRWCARDSAGV